MANNLSPELLKFLTERSPILEGSGAQNFNFYTDPATGRQYRPTYSDSPSGGEHNYALNGFQGTDAGPRAMGKPGEYYDVGGNQTGSFADNTDFGYDGFDKLVLGTLAAMTGGAAYGALGGGAALSGGTGVTVGGPMSVGGATGAELGALGAAGGAAPLVGSSAGMVAPAGLGAAAGGTGLYGAGMGAAGAGGLLSSLGSGVSSLGGSNLLGLGATALGALAGSQGQENETTTAKDIPAWLKPSVEKMLGYSGGLLDKQMQPGYLQGYDDMRSVGQGLLNQPVAGNGFNLFTKGRY